MTTNPRERIAEAIALFPSTFGLRAFPDDTFRITEPFSYVNDSGVTMLVTEVLRGDQWVQFGKGSIAELNAEIVHLDVDYRKAMDILRAEQVHSPAIVKFNNRYHAFSRTKLLASGATIREVLITLGHWPERKGETEPKFSAVGNDIFQGEGVIAQARSVTMAKRIANALNEYVPGWRKY